MLPVKQGGECYPGGGWGLDFAEFFCWEMIWRCHAFDVAEKQNKIKKNKMQRGSQGIRWHWEEGVVLCLSRAGAAHSWLLHTLHGLVHLLGLMLLLGLRVHPRAIPSFPSPCLSLHTDLGAPQDPGNAQQVISQAKWWCPNTQADQNLASSPDSFLHVNPGKQYGFHWDL